MCTYLSFLNMIHIFSKVQYTACELLKVKDFKNEIPSKLTVGVKLANTYCRLCLSYMT